MMTESTLLAVPGVSFLHFVDEKKWRVLSKELRQKGLYVAEGRLSDVSTKTELLRVVAECMKFPDYFGYNWDALDECLRDMEWCPSRGYILALRDATSGWKTAPRLMGELADCWAFAAKEWVASSTAFHLVFVW